MIKESDMDIAFRAEMGVKNSKFYRLFKEIAKSILWTGDEPLYEITESKFLLLLAQLSLNPDWLLPEQKGDV